MRRRDRLQFGDGADVPESAAAEAERCRLETEIGQVRDHILMLMRIVDGPAEEARNFALWLSNREGNEEPELELEEAEEEVDDTSDLESCKAVRGDSADDNSNGGLESEQNETEEDGDDTSDSETARGFDSTENSSDHDSDLRQEEMEEDGDHFSANATTREDSVESEEQ